MSYTIQQDEKSFCSECHGKLKLLCDKRAMMRRSAFYICWACHKIWHVGHGPVEEDSHNANS